jgi:GT2 family glycosyltransferase
MPSVAVIVLNYNGRSFLGPCLESLRRLATPVEIIVADNASTDESVAYLQREWPEVRVLVFEENLGFAAGYNRAIAEAQSEWIVMLNNDATLAPDWVERLLNAAAQKPCAAVLGGKLLFSHAPQGRRIIQSAGAFYTDAGTAFEIGWGEADRGQYDQARPVASIPGAALLMRRAVFSELGGFDPAYFAYLEDVDLCWRAWLAGHEVWYIPQAEAFHHMGGSFGGRASPLRIKWMQRNRYANMVKHLQPATLARGLLTSAAYDVYRVLEFSGRGQWDGLRALIAGTWAFGQGVPGLLRQRREIQAARQVTDQTLARQGLLSPALSAFREYRRLARLAA